MTDGRPPRLAGEDAVQYGNRCLAMAGRKDIEWYWQSAGVARLRDTAMRYQSKLDLGR